MSRDPEFTADFLKRHQDKLLFGSDCGCGDGHGGGVSQNNNPAARTNGGEVRCARDVERAEAVDVARVFQKIVWGNAHKLLRIPA